MWTHVTRDLPVQWSSNNSSNNWSYDLKNVTTSWSPNARYPVFRKRWSFNHSVSHVIHTGVPHRSPRSFRTSVYTVYSSSR